MKEHISLVKQQIMVEYNIAEEDILEINIHQMTKEEAKVFLEIEIESSPKDIKLLEIIHRILRWAEFT